jgi:hypothetical protein
MHAESLNAHGKGRNEREPVVPNPAFLGCRVRISLTRSAISPQEVRTRAETSDNQCEALSSKDTAQRLHSSIVRRHGQAPIFP